MPQALHLSFRAKDNNPRGEQAGRIPQVVCSHLRSSTLCLLLGLQSMPAGQSPAWPQLVRRALCRASLGSADQVGVERQDA